MVCPGERVASREEFVTDMAVLSDGATLVLQAGKRTLSLKGDDLEHYKGERGRRGNKLPRGFQRVDALLVWMFRSNQFLHMKSVISCRLQV